MGPPTTPELHLALSDASVLASQTGRPQDPSGFRPGWRGVGTWKARGREGEGRPHPSAPALPPKRSSRPHSESELQSPALQDRLGRHPARVVSSEPPSPRPRPAPASRSPVVTLPERPSRRPGQRGLRAGAAVRARASSWSSSSGSAPPASSRSARAPRGRWSGRAAGGARRGGASTRLFPQPRPRRPARPAPPAATRRPPRRPGRPPPVPPCPRRPGPGRREGRRGEVGSCGSHLTLGDEGAPGRVCFPVCASWLLRGG